MKKQPATSLMPGEARRFFDFVGVILVALDRDGIITNVNKRACKALSLKQSEIIGKDWIDSFVPRGNRDEVKRRFKSVMAGRARPVENYESRILAADGEERFVFWHSTLLRDERGRITGTLSSGMDITECKKADEALRLQAVIIQNLAEGVSLIGFDDGLIKYTNPRFGRMFGYKTRELIGKPVSVLNTPIDKPPEETAKEILGALKKTREWHGEIHNIRKDGTTFWCYANAALFDHPEHGKVIVSIHTDITERKLAEDALRESEQKYRDLVDLLPQTVFEIDLKGGVTYLNRKGFTLLGYTPKDFRKGANALDMFVPNDRDRIRAKIDGILRGESIRGFACTALKKDGKAFPVTVYVSVVHDHGGPTGFRGVAIDMTDLRKAKDEVLTRSLELERAYGELKYMNMVKEDFVSTISHALKTPLTSIMSFISLFRSGKLGRVTDMQKEAIEAMQSESDRLFMLVNNVLDASKVETNNFVLYRDKVDLRSLIESSMKRLANSAKDRGNVMSLHSPKQLYASFDRSWVDKVLENIISNSIKFTTEGTIKINLYRVSGGVKFSLTDTGRGIAKEALPKVFEKFYQGQRQSGTGTGLGLYISKRVIDAHGGKIGAESPGPGKGCTIWFTLPD